MTRIRSQVAYEALVSHSCVFCVAHVSVKGVFVSHVSVKGVIVPCVVVKSLVQVNLQVALRVRVAFLYYPARAPEFVNMIV